MALLSWQVLLALHLFLHLAFAPDDVILTFAQGAAIDTRQLALNLQADRTMVRRACLLLLRKTLPPPMPL